MYYFLFLCAPMLTPTMVVNLQNIFCMFQIRIAWICNCFCVCGMDSMKLLAQPVCLYKSLKKLLYKLARILICMVVFSIWHQHHKNPYFTSALYLYKGFENPIFIAISQDQCSIGWPVGNIFMVYVNLNMFLSIIYDPPVQSHQGSHSLQQVSATPLLHTLYCCAAYSLLFMSNLLIFKCYKQYTGIYNTWLTERAGLSLCGSQERIHLWSVYWCIALLFDLTLGFFCFLLW